MFNMNSNETLSLTNLIVKILIFGAETVDPLTFRVSNAKKLLRNENFN